MRLCWVALLSALLTGCFMAGNYHSARTLEKGTSSVGATFSAITYEFNDDNGTPTDSSDDETIAFAWPTIIPEFSFHTGISDDLEVGGRVSPAAASLELDLKYRFVHSGPLHAAVVPAIGYQAAFLFRGIILRLDGVLTYDLSENLSVTGALFGSRTEYDLLIDFDEANQFDGVWASAGGAIGIDIRGETAYFRPSIEFTRHLINFENDTLPSFNTVSFNLHFGIILGREKKQLDRIERKIDRLSEEPANPPPSGGGDTPPPDAPPPPPPP